MDFGVPFPEDWPHNSFSCFYAPISYDLAGFLDWQDDLAGSASSSWGGPIPERSKLVFLIDKMTSPARQAHLGGDPSLRGPSWFSWLIRWPRQLGKLILGGPIPDRSKLVFWLIIRPRQLRKLILGGPIPDRSKLFFLIGYMTSPARQAHLGGDPSLTGPSWFFDWLYDLASSASSSWGGPILDRSKLIFCWWQGFVNDIDLQAGENDTFYLGEDLQVNWKRMQDQKAAQVFLLDQRGCTWNTRHAGYTLHAGYIVNS